MSKVIRREIPLLLVSFSAILMILDYFFPVPVLSSSAKLTNEWVVVIAGFSLCLGATDLIIVNTRRIMRKTPGSGYALLIIISFLLTLLLGLSSPMTKHPAFQWIYDYFYRPPAGTLYGMLALYLVSAGWRAFKIRTFESVIMLVCAWFLIMANAPIAAVVWEGFPSIGKWIMDVPSAAGWRAFYIGAAIGTLALGLKVILGLERGALGE